MRLKCLFVPFIAFFTTTLQANSDLRNIIAIQQSQITNLIKRIETLESNKIPHQIYSNAKILPDQSLSIPLPVAGFVVARIINGNHSYFCTIHGSYNWAANNAASSTLTTIPCDGGASAGGIRPLCKFEINTKTGGVPFLDISDCNKEYQYTIFSIGY